MGRVHTHTHSERRERDRMRGGRKGVAQREVGRGGAYERERRREGVVMSMDQIIEKSVEKVAGKLENLIIFIITEWRIGKTEKKSVDTELKKDM